MSAEDFLRWGPRLLDLLRTIIRSGKNPDQELVKLQRHYTALATGGAASEEEIEGRAGGGRKEGGE